jgi:DNA sulfur modification protein DndB
MYVKKITYKRTNFQESIHEVSAMRPRFGYAFPAIRGIQAQREYYASMCPLRLIPKIFYFDEEEAELSPELRAQRTLNKTRVPEIASYLVNNPLDYAFSAITASINAEVEFEPLGADSQSSQIGLLRVPMDARFIINDGQHRRAAIEAAIREKPELGDESIAVVFFIDRGLARCQQLFADLNRHAIRPSKSIGVLYDHRDDMAQISRRIVLKSEVFRDLVEMDKSSLAARSRKLFTLSAIYTATISLLDRVALADRDVATKIAIEYWEEVARHIPEWDRVRQGKISAGEIRQDYIHSHGIALHALGKVGNHLLLNHPDKWREKLTMLRKINWSRANGALWEGRAMVGGRLSKAAQHVTLTTVALKTILGVPLDADEEGAELARRKSVNV